MTAPLPIDAQRVWTDLASDPAFIAAIAEPAHPAYRKFVESALAALDGRLDEPLTLMSFARAKAEVVAHAIGSEAAESVIAQLPEDELPFPRQEMTEMMTDSLTLLHASLFRAACEGSGCGDVRHILALPPVGLGPAALEAHDRGGFTLRDLFLLQPAAFLLMTSD